MKWKEAAILLLQPDDQTIRECAYAWRKRYAVPAERCFSHRFSRRQVHGEPLPPGFTELGRNSLSFSGLETKLIIVSHGNPYEVGNGRTAQDAAAFAAQLAVWGLKEAGLLAFRNCLIGKRTFLDDLVMSLSTWGIGVGWLIGYKREAYSVRIDPSWLMASTNAAETILTESPPGCGHPLRGRRRPAPQTQPYEATGFFDRLLREATNGRRKLPDDRRVKIVRGNRFVLPPGGPSRRYTAFLETEV